MGAESLNQQSWVMDNLRQPGLLHAFIWHCFTFGITPVDTRMVLTTAELRSCLCQCSRYTRKLHSQGRLTVWTSSLKLSDWSNICLQVPSNINSNLITIWSDCGGRRYGLLTLHQGILIHKPCSEMNSFEPTLISKKSQHSIAKFQGLLENQPYSTQKTVK